MPNEIKEILPAADSVKSLLEAGRAMGEVLTKHGGSPVVIVPQHYRVEVLDVPEEKIAQSVTLADVDSFAAYVNKFRMPGALMFATINDAGCSIAAHLDYHDAPFLEGTMFCPTWSSHVARLACVPTKEWTTWMTHNGPQGKKDQTGFALFLEDNERLFREPTGAELLELVSSLEGKSDVRFSSAVRLSNGKARLVYEEDVELRGNVGSAVTGALEIPTGLLCGIAPFEGLPPYEVRSRLRYRIESRKLTFWYETIAPHLIVREAATGVLAAVAALVQAPLLRVA